MSFSTSDTLDPVEVANDAVLEAGGGNRKLQSLLLIIAGIQPVDEAAGKAVAAAHTVYHVAYSGKPWFLKPRSSGRHLQSSPFFQYLRPKPHQFFRFCRVDINMLVIFLSIAGEAFINFW